MKISAPFIRGSVFALVALIAIVLVVACSDSGSPVSPSPTGRIDTTLRPGDSVQLSSSATLKFDKVAGDSRCPTGAVCVWMGEATVQLTLNDSSGSETFRLTTLKPQETVHGYRIRLVKVEPYPQLNSEIAPDAYRISLRVGD